jgi:hydroxymethylbilane synthase
VGRILPSRTFLPVPAQGAIAVVTRTGDADLARVVGRVDHAATRACVTAERTFASELGGDCRVPLGALATIRGRALSLVGEVLTVDGRTRLRTHRRGPVSEAASLGSRLGKVMLDRGALELLSPGNR